MTSKYFTPGKTSARARFSSESSAFNNYFPCQCGDAAGNNKILMDGYPNRSTAQLRADRILSAQGGKTGFGNYNTGGNTTVNYLGKVEGQLGGSGKPLRNQY